jgi:acyl carrier protein
MSDPGRTLTPGDRAARRGSWRKTGMNTLNRLAIRVLAYHMNREESAIRPTDRLYEDLGLTTLGLALVILEIEDACGLELPPDRLDSLETVRDLLATFAGGSARERRPSLRRSSDQLNVHR